MSLLAAVVANKEAGPRIRLLWGGFAVLFGLPAALNFRGFADWVGEGKFLGPMAQRLGGALFAAAGAYVLITGFMEIFGSS